VDFETLFVESKWRILTELAQKKQSPTELAKKTNTSVANISQQLRLLEAYGIVKKQKVKSKNEPGKPRTLYEIGKEATHIIHIERTIAEKKLFEKNNWTQAAINALMLEKEEDAYFIIKFLCKEEIFNKCKSLFIIRNNHDSIEVLLITKNFEDIRKDYSSIELTGLNNNKKKIIIWSHDLPEIETGITEKNEYFINLTNKMRIIYDPSNLKEQIENVRTRNL